METKHTQRGFSYVEFSDANGVECNIQKSSLATDDAIWIGAKEIGLKKFTPYSGWEDQDTRGEPPYGVSFIANNRMHLTREQVADLLPLLTRFVETGEVSTEAPGDAPNPSAAFSDWINKGPKLASAAGCHVGITVRAATDPEAA